MPVPFHRGRGLLGEIEEAVARTSVGVLCLEEMVGGKEVSGVAIGELGIYASMGVGRVGGWWGGDGGGRNVEGEGDKRRRETELEAVGVAGAWRVGAWSGVVPADTSSTLSKWVGIVAGEIRAYLGPLYEIFELRDGPGGGAGCGVRRWFLKPASSFLGGGCGC